MLRSNAMIQQNKCYFISLSGNEVVLFDDEVHVKFE